MKKRVLQILAILGINLVIGLLTGVAFLLYFFICDPILTAVPVFLALPGILLQPWFVPLFFMSYGPLLAPFLTTIITVPIWILLDRKGKLDRAKHVLAPLKSWKAIAVVGLVVFCALAVGLARLVDFPALHRGIPTRDLQDIVFEDMQLDPNTVRYYCLFHAINSQWLLQARLSEQDLDVLAKELGMQPIPADRIGNIYRHMPPYWWRPMISDRVRILATTGFRMRSRGPDGLNVLATWNPEDEILHMWIKDNF